MTSCDVVPCNSSCQVGGAAATPRSRDWGVMGADQRAPGSQAAGSQPRPQVRHPRPAGSRLPAILGSYLTRRTKLLCVPHLQPTSHSCCTKQQPLQNSYANFGTAPCECHQTAPLLIPFGCAVHYVDLPRLCLELAFRVHKSSKRKTSSLFTGQSRYLGAAV